jgi:hypothetical protein
MALLLKIVHPFQETHIYQKKKIHNLVIIIRGKNCKLPGKSPKTLFIHEYF